MTPELAIELFKNTILFALYMVAPFLGVALVVGLITSIIQSVTSMQEQTLAFAPKLVAMSVLVILLGPWLLKSLTEFTIQMISKMSQLN